MLPYYSREIQSRGGHMGKGHVSDLITVTFLAVSLIHSQDS